MWTTFSESERPKLPHKSLPQQEDGLLHLRNEGQIATNCIHAKEEVTDSLI